MSKKSRSFGSLYGLVAAAAISVVALSGCGTTFAMQPDPSVPFAMGQVDASFEKDGNGTMKVKVQHLGDPAKLNPAATTYVVWIKPHSDKQDVKPQNMGSIKVDSDYSGSIQFTTTFKGFDITITPEPAPDVTTPSGRDILKASISAS